ncbi:hypothetical protein ACFL1X_13315 [Candidatus Hydrogenedentota bacterium]
MKECTGRCEFAQIKYINRSQMHYVAINEEKKAECQACEEFAECSWETTLKLMKGLLKMYDEMNKKRMPNI